MARHARLRGYQSQYNNRIHGAIERLATLMMLAAAESDDDLTSTAALLLLIRNRKKTAARSGRYGFRGFYDQVKSVDFFDNILYDSTDRAFKSWLRYVNFIPRARSWS